MKSRRACREYAVQGLYQCDIVGDLRHGKVEEFLSHLCAYPEFATYDPEEAGPTPETASHEPAKLTIQVSEFCRNLLHGVLENLEAIDAALARSSTNWSVNRMVAVDRSILRIATYELLFSPDVPAKVIINEAVEIAKDFSGGESYLFINGVLDRVRELVREAS
jgi:N utilization substance protein B